MAGQIPRKPDEITTSWLNSVLAGDATGRIGSFDAKEIGEGTGLLGQILRLRLHWDDPTDGPRSVIAKFQSPDPGLREVVRSFGWYTAEVRFYRELAREVSVRTPACYLALHDPETQDTLLLLEDISFDKAVDQIRGCPLDRAAQAVDALADIHGTWWEHPRLDDLLWIPRFDEPNRIETLTGFYRNSREAALERLGDRIPAWFAEADRKLEECLPAIMRRLNGYPATLAHHDTRLDNLLFGTGRDGTPSLTIIDWQFITRGPGATDLANLLTQGLTVRDRREHEGDLVVRYRDRLAEHGVHDITLEQIHEVYRLYCLFLLVLPINAAAAVDMGSRRAVDLLHSMAERVFAAAEDRDVLGLLSTIDPR